MSLQTLFWIELIVAIVTFPVILMSSFKKLEETEKEERRKRGVEEKITPLSCPENNKMSRVIMYTMVSMVLVWFLVAHKGHISQTATTGWRQVTKLFAHKSEKVQPARREEPEIVLTPVREEEPEVRRGTLTWERPEGTQEEISQKRRDVLEVEYRDNEEVVEFTAKYYTSNGELQKAEFRGEKREDGTVEGTWSQRNPSGSGSWHLEPSEEDSRVFRGDVSTERGTVVPMTLELGDTG